MFNKTIALNNGVQMPMVGFGVFRMQNGGETSRAVETALRAGYRHIDTAAIYGNEAEVGEGIRNSGVPREEIFLTTKLWNDDMRSGRIQQAFEKSLALLGVEYVDLYLVHWPVAGKFVAAYNFMEALYAKGKIRAIGVSNFNCHHLEELLAQCKVVPAVNQIERHPQLAQLDLIAYCKAQGIAVEAYAPFGGEGAPVLALPAVKQMAEKYGKTPAQVVLQWNIQQGLVPLPKSTKPLRIAENIALGFVLKEEDIRSLEDINENRRYNADPETFDF